MVYWNLRDLTYRDKYCVPSWHLPRFDRCLLNENSVKEWTYLQKHFYENKYFSELPHFQNRSTVLRWGTKFNRTLLSINILEMFIAVLICTSRLNRPQSWSWTCKTEIIIMPTWKGHWWRQVRTNGRGYRKKWTIYSNS